MKLELSSLGNAAEEVYKIAAKFLNYAKKLLESLESRND